MGLYEARGDRARALRVYHEGVAVLADKLGVAPSAETRAAYQALLPTAETAPTTSAGNPFVGRQPERRRLGEAWRAARAGHAQLVLVSGEPGIGKTRLVEELRHWAERRGAVTAVARSYLVEGALPYAPVVGWLRELSIARWRSRLDPAHLAQLARLLPEAAEDSAPDDPQARLQLFDAAARALLAGPEAVLLVADNLPAADAQTLQFLHYLLRAEPQARLLIVATGRLAETDAGDPVQALLAGLRTIGRGSTLDLHRLDAVETAVLAERLTRRRIGDADHAWLHEETGGNPLFLVETLRDGWPDSGRPAILTPRTHALLETRLHQLSVGARTLLGLAATAGGPLPVDLLTTARADDADVAASVGRELDELWRRQLLLATGPATYDFSHDKLRDVAYAELTPTQRRGNHHALARALQELHASRPDDVAAQIAGHLQAAGADDQATDWYARAAAAARRVSADTDAARLLDRALDTVRSTPVSPQRQQRELDLLTARLAPLAAAEGYASSRLGAVVTAALDLSRDLGAVPSPPLLRARGMAVLSHSDFATALDLGGQLRARGEAEADPAEAAVLIVEGAFVSGVATYWRGDLKEARTHLQAAVSEYRPENRAAHLSAFAQDPQVLAVARLAHIEFFAGDQVEARRLQGASLDLADQVGHPFTRGAALLFAALLDLELDDVEAVRARVADLDELRRRLDFPAFRLFAEAVHGYLDVVDGRSASGHARIDATLEDPGAVTAPGVPAMLLRIRLAGCGDDRPRAVDTAQRLLADDVGVWDALAHGTLEERPGGNPHPYD
jgi:hypothetical protein